MQNFSSNLSLSEFAHLCARSLAGFKREFMELYGTTPGKWLLNKRLEYSKYLLKTADLTIGKKEEMCCCYKFPHSFFANYNQLIFACQY